MMTMEQSQSLNPNSYDFELQSQISIPNSNSYEEQEALPPPQKVRKSRSKSKQNQNLPIGGSEVTSSNDVAPVTAKPKQPNAKLISDLAAIYASIGNIICMGDTYSGTVIAMAATERATEVVNVAKHHPEMMKFLKQFVAGNDYMALALGHGMMVYGILCHFKVIPPSPMLSLVGLSEEQIMGGDR